MDDQSGLLGAGWLSDHSVTELSYRRNARGAAERIVLAEALAF
jgi:hypothetical protein